MLAAPLIAALEEALEKPLPGDPTRSDRLALAVWWLIESVADEIGMPFEEAANEVAMLCGLAKEMRGHDPPQSPSEWHFTS